MGFMINNTLEKYYKATSALSGSHPDKDVTFKDGEDAYEMIIKL